MQESSIAQTLMCCGAGTVTVDLTNAHAPSGNKKLTKEQRKKLLTNVLQSNSKSMLAQALGNACTVQSSIAWFLRSAPKPLEDQGRGFVQGHSWSFSPPTS